MNCPNCGNPIVNGAMFCGNCGQRLAQQQPAPVNQQNAYPQNTYQQQPAYPQNIYQQSAYPQPVNQRPARQLVCSRGAVKSILLTLITLGIYSIVLFTKMAEELNITASKYDGKKTMNYCLLFFIVGPLTLGIGYIVWAHKFSSRIGDELRRRGVDYSFGASDFWLWNVLGLLILVGPFVYLHKITKAINLINEDYNNKG